MNIFILFILFFLVTCNDQTRIETCATTPLKDTAFCDQSLSYDERINYILPKLTLKEKIGIMDRYNPYIERFNISYFNFRCEALHGLGKSTCQYGDHHVVSYPQVINLGRTFDRDGIYKMTQQISDSAWALFNTEQFQGVSFYSPVVNLIRDPRWGRLQENAGEDPYLLGEYGKAFINGMIEGSDSRYAKTIPAVKHFTAYDLENWNGITRHNFDAKVTDQDMKDSFNLPFEIVMKNTKIKQSMCSYNSINGIPACANYNYLKDLVKEEWKWQGFFLSDLGAVEDMYKNHKYVPTAEDAVAVSIKGGMDLNDGRQFREHLENSVKKGKINETEFDDPIRRILRTRFEIGEFDNWADQPYRKIGIEVVNSDEHKSHSLELSRKSLVLLKNNNDTLPLNNNKIKSIGIIGPHIVAEDTLCGTYQGPHDTVETPEQVLLKYTHKHDIDVYRAMGCETIACKTKLFFEEAILVAKKTDVNIVFVGLNDKQEKEALDRKTLEFPGHQEDLIKEVVKHSKGKVIVVLIKGGPIDISYLKENVDAIIDAGYPGQFGSQAIIELLFGEYSPAGKLTYTVYPKDFISIPMTYMRMRPSEEDNYPGRTYRFYNGKKIYEFGDGLSYTTFDYQWIDESDLYLTKSNLQNEISCKVTNTGKVNSDVVVLMYAQNLMRDDAPIKELKGFERVNLESGESKIIKFSVDENTFSYVNKKGERLIENGEFLIMIENLKKKVEII